MFLTREAPENWVKEGQQVKRGVYQSSKTDLLSCVCFPDCTWNISAFSICSPLDVLLCKGEIKMNGATGLSLPLLISISPCQSGLSYTYLSALTYHDPHMQFTDLISGGLASPGQYSSNEMNMTDTKWSQQSLVKDLGKFTCIAAVQKRHKNWKDFKIVLLRPALLFYIYY